MLCAIAIQIRNNMQWKWKKKDGFQSENSFINIGDKKIERNLIESLLDASDWHHNKLEQLIRNIHSQFLWVIYWKKQLNGWIKGFIEMKFEVRFRMRFKDIFYNWFCSSTVVGYQHNTWIWNITERMVSTALLRF